MQGWQLKLAPVEDEPLKASAKSSSKVAPQQPLLAKEYGADLPFRQPTPDRNADDVVLALCSGHGVNGAAPADDRYVHLSSRTCVFSILLNFLYYMQCLTT